MLYYLFHARCFTCRTWRRNVNATKGSGGQLLFIKNSMLSRVKVISNHDDKVIWVCVQNKVSDINSVILLAFTYYAPYRTPYWDSELLDKIREDIVEFKAKYDVVEVILLGDLNAHTNTQPDYIVNDSTAFVPSPEYYVSDLPCEIFNRDERTVNFNGRQLLDFCQITGLRIVML